MSPVKTLILWLHHHITAKIIIAVLGGVGAIGLIQGYLALRAEQAWLADDFRTQARALAAAVHAVGCGPSGSEALRKEDLARLLADLRTALDARRVALVAGNGTVLLSSDAADTGRPLQSEDDAPASAGDSHRSRVPLHGSDCRAGEPAALAGAAELVVDQSAALHAAHLHEAHRLLEYFRYAAILVVTGLVILVVFVVVQRPIAGLTGAVSRIEKGDLTVRCETPARDEFGRLADGLNSMLNSLQEKNRDLEIMHETHLLQADRVASIGQLASGLAHEIKNPLHGISSALTVIRGRVDEGTGTIIDEIRDRIAEVVRTLTDMLSYARPKESRFELCNPVQILDRTLPLVHADLDTRGIELARDVEDDLPEILLDREKMQQVYLNLILNAMQATGDGGHVHVSIRWDRVSNLIVSRVEDDGPGVSEDMKARIFEPFFTTKKQGHGLGLATSKMLVEHNNGVLRLAEREGPGACFEILLPVLTSGEIGPREGPSAAPDDGDVEVAATDAYLFDLACRCPLGRDSNCPAAAIRSIRMLDLADRPDAVRELDPETKKRLRAVHVRCCYAHRGDGRRTARPGETAADNRDRSG